MIIIASASYINQEFSSEFGLIPPAFLPVGNKRLFNYQQSSLPTGERCVLPVPDSFSVSTYDQARLDSLNVEVLHIPEDLSLGESIVCAINLAGNPPNSPVRILHGDTLISDLPGNALDVITLSEVDGAYNWAVWHETGDDLLTQLDDSPMVGRIKIANGYFAFSDCGLLIRSMIRANGNFISGVNAYSRAQTLAPVEVQHWLDFGHGHTFYRSKARMTTQRAFNNLEIGQKVVLKTSADKKKMQAEYHWFLTLPDDLRVFTPQLIRALHEPETGYEIQYLYLASLNELIVFGQIPRFAWRTIFKACFAFLEACRQHPPAKPDSENVSSVFRDKTLQRLSSYCDDAEIDMSTPWTINGIATPSLNEIVERTSAMIPSLQGEEQCVIHGDFCFSNILYDFRAQAIKVIDPRGRSSDGALSIHGDPRYDLAKLAHSACGFYDYIIAGYYTVESSEYVLTLDLLSNEFTQQIHDMFLDMVEQHFGLDKKVMYAMQVHLFLSMIPLHTEDEKRQQAFLANALRLFTEIG